MQQEKRRGEPPVPSNLDHLINTDQLLTLRQIENFGWQVEFVRRPLFQDTVVVVSSTDNRKIGVLEDTGELNLHPDIKLRAQAS